MKKLLLILTSLICTFCSGQDNVYEKAWKSLNENKRTEAASLLATAEKDPASFNDAYITKLYLASYNGKESSINDFDQAFYSKAANPYPYLYALWLNGSVLGTPGKRLFERQVKLMDHIITDSKAPGSIIAAANYQRGVHCLFSNEAEKAEHYYNEVGALRNWQYAGPFENLSKSGFYKNYGPLDHPQPDAVFKSLTNADVKWIVPTAESKEGWIPLCYQYNVQTAVVYAQNFVSSATDQVVQCAIGVAGSVKVWINDELVMAEVKERETELDVYTVQCSLKKGVNRILVQVGFTSSSFPNFCLRFTDDNFLPIKNVAGSTTFAPYPKVNGGNKNYTLLPHFAEAFFQDKISKQPSNLLNYLLLADVYLRNQKLIEARNLVTEGLAIAPDNCLLNLKMAEVLTKEDNKTLLQEQLEKIKQADPENMKVMDTYIKEFFDNQKYEDGAALLEKRIQFHGEDLTTASYKILLLVQEKKYDELVKELEKIAAMYPDHSQFLESMYAIKKEIYKDNKAALKVYEDYMNKNFNYSVYEKYAQLLSDQGNETRALEIKKKLTELFPYSPDGFYKLSDYHYSTKQYDKAEGYIRQALALSPYNEYYWEKLGDIQGEKKNKDGSLDAFNRSLQYNPNQYSILNKIRKLNGKSEMYKLFAEADITKLIKEDKTTEAKNTDYGYYYILDQKDVILYPGGATEEYYTFLIRITNEKGVDRYKESSITYNNSQSLLIEKAEVIKKSQARIEGERNGNEVVFTNLEVGDVVVFKYRLQSYVYGRFAKEYWDRYYFNAQIYSAAAKYTLLAQADLKINYVVNNGSLNPVIKEVENFKQYTWELYKQIPEKDEPFMPVMADITPVLHVSTIPNWSEIASWYSDICNNKAEEDFEIIALYKKLFPDGQPPMTQFQKAKRIYEYIESNIRYSSVSFRQSAYVPQRPSATLSTRLGDCKDLSSLFVTLAHMAGINAQMVLVDTRDNGEKQIILPSVEFNHCIVRTILDNKSYYIEMTDNYLPFTSLPDNLLGAVILEIPSKNITEKTELKLLKSPNRTSDVVKRIVDITPGDADLSVTVKTVMRGALSSNIRYEYGNLDGEKQLQGMEKAVAGRYKNNVKMDKLNFKDLVQLNDSVEYSYSYRVKNEIAEIGSLKTFRVVYPDVVASLDNFTADTRTYQLEYWKYENADSYETVVNINAPAGTKFVELPASESHSFKDMKFTIQYTLRSPNKLVITRKFTNGRQNIPASDYASFKSFFEKVVKAEQKFVAYK